MKYLNLAEFSPKSLFRSWFACWLLRWLLWTESLNTFWEIPPIKGGRITGVSRSLLPCLVSQFADWGLYGKNYLGIGKEELIKLPLVGFPGTNPCKMHRDIPVKLPLWLNLTPLVTITNVSLAKCAPGCWIRLPYMAHGTLNPRTERKAKKLRWITQSAPALHLHTIKNLHYSKFLTTRTTTFW